MASSATGRLTAHDSTEVKQREKKAVDLALAGHTFDEIADQCGYSSRSGAWQAVQRLLSREAAASADQLRAVDGQRIERLILAHWGRAVNGDVKATDTVLRLLARKARLFGLDAPLVADVTIRNEVDEQIRQLAAELEAKASAAP